MVTKLNSKSLRKLAVDTGGKYFEINDNQNDVSRLIRAINEVEGEVRDARMVDASANKFYYFLIGALVLMVIDALTKKKNIENMKVWLSILLFFVGNSTDPVTKIAKANKLKKEAKAAYDSSDFSAAIQAYSLLIDSLEVEDNKQD